jgi:hypothetical protein
VRKSIIAAFGVCVLLAGCGDQGDKGGIPVGPKWKGAPYRISFDKPPEKPNPAGVTIPQVKYTANPEALETRVTLVLRFETPGGAQKEPVVNRMIAPPVDIRGPEGELPADYMERASKGLSTFLGAQCMKGKVNVSVAIARSSLNPQAGDGEVDEKRLSDWLPIDLTFKNPHPKC